MDFKSKSILIACFSRRGNNYVNGKIVNLTVGNTEVIAGMIQEITGGDLFHIKPIQPYPEDYTETTEVAKQELRTDARPDFIGAVEDLESYEAIFLGYPNWWATMPMPVFTFLEKYDLAGKTIVPFCTHEGSGMGRSLRDIKKTCPKSKVLDGIAIKGSEVNKAKNTVEKWLQSLNLANNR